MFVDLEDGGAKSFELFKDVFFVGRLENPSGDNLREFFPLEAVSVFQESDYPPIVFGLLKFESELAATIERQRL